MIAKTQALLCGALFTFSGSTALLLLGPAAHADTTPPTLKVRYADLDVVKPAGAKALYHRIQSAAAEVCGVNDSRDPALRAHAHDCALHAVAAAVQQVDKPLLTDLHAGRSLRVASR